MFGLGSHWVSELSVHASTAAAATAISFHLLLAALRAAEGGVWLSPDQQRCELLIISHYSVALPTEIPLKCGVSGA